MSEVLFPVLIYVCVLFPFVFGLITFGNVTLASLLTSIFAPTVYFVVFCLNYYVLADRHIRHTLPTGRFLLFNAAIALAGCVLLPIFYEILIPLVLPPPGSIRIPPHPAGKIAACVLSTMRDGIMIITAIALAYTFRSMRSSQQQRQDMLELNTRRQELEIAGLKSQLNPHFLFNTLNNIYALVQFSPAKAQQAISELGSMLRYTVYESGTSTTRLDGEIRFINDYVALMRLRHSDRLRVDVSTVSDPDPDIRITPMIFMTLVENAFKHFDKETPEPFISIAIRTDSGTKVTCEVSNSFRPPAAGSRQGVGLANIRRQLEYFYPGGFSLTAGAEGKVFTAALTIDTDKYKINNINIQNKK